MQNCCNREVHYVSENGRVEGLILESGQGSQDGLQFLYQVIYCRSATNLDNRYSKKSNQINILV